MHIYIFSVQTQFLHSGKLEKHCLGADFYPSRKLKLNFLSCLACILTCTSNYLSSIVSHNHIYKLFECLTDTIKIMNPLFIQIAPFGNLASCFNLAGMLAWHPKNMLLWSLV